MKKSLTLTMGAALLLIIVPPELAVGQETTTPAPPSAAVAPAAPGSPATPAVAAFFQGENFLGVHVEEVTRENMSGYGLSGEPRGVAVTRVVRDSPAERAGVRERDVIVRFDGEQVSSVRKLNRLIDESAPEHEARLTVRRGGSEQELKVKLGRRDTFMRAFESFEPLVVNGDLLRQGEEARALSEGARRQAEQVRKQAEELRGRAEEWRRANPGGAYAFTFGAGRRIGISTNLLGKQLADYFGVSHGALVSSVEENSPASKAGLKAGDIITEADGEKIEDAGDLSRVVNRKEEGEVTLTVVRERQRRTVKVTPERRQPQSFNLTPGAVWVTPRVAATPRPAAPAVRAVTAPRAPRPAVAPRAVRVWPGRVL